MPAGYGYDDAYIQSLVDLICRQAALNPAFAEQLDQAIKARRRNWLKNLVFKIIAPHVTGPISPVLEVVTASLLVHWKG